SRRLSRLQEEERELKMAFLDGSLSEGEYEVAASRLREMQEMLRRRLGAPEETESIRKKLEILNELYLEGAISKEEYERRKRVLGAKLKVLEGS
ncbi:MAG: SHOCT domain-containing protein, partial [Candidatus Korarchaeota archaeon]|nr:SHOCT domain-containing protein [Candidatus Korarchaeota archaeon]